MLKNHEKKIWWRYALLFTLLLVSGPTTHFISQYLRGYPLDINYFWTVLSPRGIVGSGLYNGPGGSNWKIGEAQANIWNASSLRSLPELRQFALRLVNRDRILNGLPPLIEDPLLSQAAQLHAKDMLARKYFDHISLDGKNPRDRFLAVGGSPRAGIGENISWNKGKTGLGLTYEQVEKAQRGLMYSHGHRANILEAAYTRFGYGIEMGAGNQVYVVQKFATGERVE
jgi:uncharacterized protein YkwD